MGWPFAFFSVVPAWTFGRDQGAVDPVPVAEHHYLPGADRVAVHIEVLPATSTSLPSGVTCTYCTITFGVDTTAPSAACNGDPPTIRT